MGALNHQRTVGALVLTLFAVVFPCGAWFLVGSRELERQVNDLTAIADQGARATARRLASELASRLEELRAAEAKRPFYHYQPYFHDPEGAAEGASVVPSPLSAGSRDPLIEAYFQVDAPTGNVTLPSAEAELKQLTEAQARYQRADDQLFLKRQLERGLNSITLTVRGESRSASTVSKPAETGQRVQILEQQAWMQNAAAADLYRDLRSRSAKTSQTAEPVGNISVTTNAARNIEVFIGPLKWRTVYVANVPSLVALREVTTPESSVYQGFLISAAGLDNFFKPAGLPARLLPGNPTGDFEAMLNVGAELWRVVVDATPARAAQSPKVSGLRRTFWMIFLGGTGISALAGVGVVWIVWQTERLARQRSQFAASAAHELRTPLAGLRLYSDMLTEGLGDPGKANHYAHRVAAEAERLGRVVTNVLGFTRLERGTLQVHPAVGGLAEVAQECISRQQPALEAAGVKLNFHVADELPVVRFDRDAVAQILQNLLDNAEKHTRQAERREIHVALLARNGAVEMSVADHGPGVAANLQRHLFEAFARGNTNDAPAGLGLGLVLVKALAKAQGAKVAYENNLGGGAKFTVSFPI